MPRSLDALGPLIATRFETAQRTERDHAAEDRALERASADERIRQAIEQTEILREEGDGYARDLDDRQTRIEDLVAKASALEETIAELEAERARSSEEIARMAIRLDAAVRDVQVANEARAAAEAALRSEAREAHRRAHGLAEELRQAERMRLEAEARLMAAVIGTRRPEDGAAAA